MPHLSGTPAPRRRGALAATMLLATLTGASTLTVAPPATSATSHECPAPYPVAEVHRGQRLTGLTVTEGTSPGAFSGEVLGVIRDGIAPGLDMVLARLDSAEIARVGGVWQGMSGSPLYAADGRLVGAVSYSLSTGPSPIAGITPAAEMFRMLDRSASRFRAASEVRIPPALSARLADGGVVDGAAARGGLRRLPVPVGISGMAGARRLRQLERALGLEGARVHQAGAVSAADEPIPVVAGGNLAASMSYGDVSTVGVGTATAVCGDEVIGFGHPMSHTGPSQMLLHGAETVYIQDDPTLSPFKLANAAAPSGAITQDRLAGIAGVQGAWEVPDTTDVTSYVEVPGEWSRTGSTHISVPDAVPDLAAFHLLADQDRVFDGSGGGTARVSWTIKGRRADRTPFRLTRHDRFATRSDLSSEPVLDLYDQLARIQLNESERVRIDTVDTTSVMSRTYTAYTVASVQVRKAGRWRPLSTPEPLVLRAGRTERFRVQLTSPRLGTTRVVVRLPVPERIGHKSGVLEILGGNAYVDLGTELGDPFGTPPSTDDSLDALLAQLRRAPRNDQVLASLTLYRRDGSTMQRIGRAGAGAVVNGGVAYDVLGRP